IPINNFSERISVIKEYLDTHEWDIFLGGGTKVMRRNFVKSISYKTEKLAVLKKMACAHMIFFNKKVYDFFLNMQFFAPIDTCWWNRITALVPSPFIASQDHGFSNVCNTVQNYQKIIELNSGILSQMIATI